MNEMWIFFKKSSFVIPLKFPSEFSFDWSIPEIPILIFPMYISNKTPSNPIEKTLSNPFL